MAASRRVLTFSLRRMAATWDSTVRTDRTSRPAISALVRPSTNSRATFACCWVSPARLPRVVEAGPRGMRGDAAFLEPCPDLVGERLGADRVEDGQRLEQVAGLRALRQCGRAFVRASGALPELGRLTPAPRGRQCEGMARLGYGYGLARENHPVSELGREVPVTDPAHVLVRGPEKWSDGRQVPPQPRGLGQR